MVKKSAQHAALEALRRKDRKIRWRPEDFLFDRQMDVFTSQAPYKCKRIGRRGGKSYEAATALTDAAIRWPKSTPLYVTTTRQDARDIMDPAFDLLNTTFNLGMSQNKATGDITLPNRSRILMRGASTLREINKLRGPAYPCVVIDEVQNFGPDLHYLIDEVCEPAVAQYHGWISVSGTPPPTQYGPFWDIDQGKYAHAWQHFHWTFLDNPTLPDPEKFVQRVLERRGWTRDHPGFQREYMGLWVRDEEARAFRMEPHRDVISSFDRTHAWDWQYVMGIDVGYNDPFAYVVIAASSELGQAYVVDCYQESEMTTMEALEIAESYCAQYPISQVVVDTGGAGKLVAKDWQKLTAMPVEPAKKTHKGSQISVINGDFQANRIKVAKDKCEPLIQAFMTVEWDQAQLERGKFVYPKGANDHLLDAFQYAYGVCSHQGRGASLPEYKPKLGSKGYYDWLEERIMEEHTKPNATGDPWEILERTAHQGHWRT